MTRILTDRPQNVVDIFEDLSNLEKREKFVSKVDTLIEKPDKASEIKLAEVQRSLYIVSCHSRLNDFILLFII